GHVTRLRHAHRSGPRSTLYRGGIHRADKAPRSAWAACYNQADMAPNGSTELPPPPANAGTASDASERALIDSGSLDSVEELYLRYLEDPSSVDDDWREYFAGLGPNGLAGRHLAPSFAPRSLFNPPSGASDEQLTEVG